MAKSLTKTAPASSSAATSVLANAKLGGSLMAVTGCVACAAAALNAVPVVVSAVPPAAPTV